MVSNANANAAATLKQFRKRKKKKMRKEPHSVKHQQWEGCFVVLFLQLFYRFENFQTKKTGWSRGKGRMKGIMNCISGNQTVGEEVFYGRISNFL